MSVAPKSGHWLSVAGSSALRQKRPFGGALGVSALVGDITAGTVSTLVMLCYAMSLGTLIFSADLARYAELGVPTALVSCIVTAFVIALTSSMRMNIGGPDSNATAFLVGVAAGVFVFTALVFTLVGFAWLLYYYLPGATFAYYWGFFAMAIILLVLGAVAGLIAARAVKRGSPPVPSMAIEEARKIRETVSAATEDSSPAAGTVPAGAPHPGAGAG